MENPSKNGPSNYNTGTFSSWGYGKKEKTNEKTLGCSWMLHDFPGAEARMNEEASFHRVMSFGRQHLLSQLGVFG